MLSTAAFNALLKILEEPPSHLIFILATTELHKVPATILSRCQRFAFKRIQPTDIAARLQHVAAAEGMQLSADAAGLLARLSDGALRDALSLLDQCGAAGGTIDGARVLDVLGLAGNVQTAQLMECIIRRDVQSTLLWLDRLYSGGKDVNALLGELSALTRDILIRMTAPEGGAALLSGAYDTAMMDNLAQGMPPTRLIYMTTQLQNTLAALPLSANRRTDAELCLMRLCDESLCGDVTALCARLARLEEGGLPATAAAPVAAPRPAPAAPTQKIPPAAKPLPVAPPVSEAPPWEEPAPASPPWEDAPPAYDDSDAPPPYGEPIAPQTVPTPAPAPVPISTPAPAPAAQSVGGGSDLWWSLIEKYKDRVSPMYQYMLDDACGSLEGDVLIVRCGDDLTHDTLDCPPVIDALSSVTSQHLGRAISVRFMIGKSDAQNNEDRMDVLIRNGSKFENFKVK